MNRIYELLKTILEKLDVQDKTHRINDTRSRVRISCSRYSSSGDSSINKVRHGKRCE